MARWAYSVLCETSVLIFYQWKIFPHCLDKWLLYARLVWKFPEFWSTRFLLGASVVVMQCAVGVLFQLRPNSEYNLWFYVFFGLTKAEKLWYMLLIVPYMECLRNFSVLADDAKVSLLWTFRIYNQHSVCQPWEAALCVCWWHWVSVDRAEIIFPSDSD